MIATVARILIALYKNHVVTPTAISHKDLAGMARCTEDQVAKVANFLTEIGVRRLKRNGRSTVSTYSLESLTASPSTLIQHFARWRGCREDFKLTVWRWWRKLHALLAQMQRYLSDVFDVLSACWQGETALPIRRLEFASISTRGPPQ